MRERIIEAIFEEWSDRILGDKGKELPEVEQVISGIVKHFNANSTDELYIEQTVMEAINRNEKRAFCQGFCLCLDFVNGSLLSRNEGLTNT